MSGWRCWRAPESVSGRRVWAASTAHPSLRAQRSNPHAPSARRPWIASASPRNDGSWKGIPCNPHPHPEAPERSEGLEGGLQESRGWLEPSFEAASQHLRMRGWVGCSSPPRHSGVPKANPESTTGHTRRRASTTGRPSFTHHGWVARFARPFGSGFSPFASPGMTAVSYPQAISGDSFAFWRERRRRMAWTSVRA
jgi:hypothetical protein